ncbi:MULTISPECIES: Holliday junction branch migration protein RuvA [unclassified Mycoplasma]|uniref:Holliday junction branch migration protein RuvA n=1 Tax=unclassified Mycoplasma TaxID=2683645 RepID=UPI00211BA8EC|nr:MULTISPECIES: Holliday junction branch migration protein RuvA [unclassified Mycoplasma]UUM19633.1 Holliday junction branch migration protein RuvA [Mycoplasma sp. 1578d]UUM24602.1 Holliday junction branch migration protein RuvA [Mycoplasma sp. 3686d]
MLLYKLGEIVYKKNNNLILESKSEGHIVVVSNESRYQVHDKIKMYFYEYNTEYNKTTYGFKDFKERLLFIDLISIDKIGPKIAMNILDKGWEYVAELISQENWQEIAKFPFISEKTARFLCVELANKWTKIMNKQIKDNSATQSQLKQLSETLNTLGFKKKQIDFAVTKVDTSKTLEEMIEQSIEIIATNQNEINIASA